MHFQIPAVAINCEEQELQIFFFFMLQEGIQLHLEEKHL